MKPASHQPQTRPKPPTLAERVITFLDVRRGLANYSADAIASQLGAHVDSIEQILRKFYREGRVKRHAGKPVTWSIVA